MNNEMKQKIDALIRENSVVLFMKGTKDQPQCGFSSRVVQVLKNFVADFHCVDILSDPQMRESIKIYSSWPTIPQLYIDGEFIGGCDIVLDLVSKKELQRLLKVTRAQNPPAITLSEAALAAFADANLERGEGEHFRLSIGADFEVGLSFDLVQDDDFSVKFGDVEIIVDPYSAVRAQGLKIDFVKDGLESGFAFENPNEPPPVQELAVQEFKKWQEEGKTVLLLDVRPKLEREKAHIPFSHSLDEMTDRDIGALQKNQPMVFFCHRGGRSRRAAESFRLRGFTHVYNLTGGIDAWSRKIDSTVPIY